MTSEMEAFFTLHRELPREGPGEAADVAWVAKTIGLKRDAQIADVACGPGGDIGALLDAAPEGHVTALDKTAHFVEAARAAWGQDARTTILRADMASVANTYDLIWCAGAVYFLGVTPALTRWRKALRADGVIAFTEPCMFMAATAPTAVLFGDYPVTDAPGIAAQVDAAGFETLATQPLSDAAWEAYFQPMEQRIARLRGGADDALAAVLDEAETEIATWRAQRETCGYLLSVVRPK